MALIFLQSFTSRFQGYLPHVIIFVESLVNLSTKKYLLSPASSELTTTLSQALNPMASVSWVLYAIIKHV